MNDIQKRVTASFNAQGLMTTLGATLSLVADGEVHIEVPYSPHISQQHGFMHGGAVGSILDSACGYAAMTKTPAGSEIVSVEFKINFVRPAIGDRFVAVGKVQTAGKLLLVSAGEVRAYTGNDYKIVALMQATMMNVQK
ncbi:PaaI family thioesterase [Alcaligenaceae bacterium]|nr:PaaI family thioesterase [Alcaligenaceae bacterium]